MILSNTQKATLIKHNRGNSGIFDDEDMEISTIKVVPYSVDLAVRFGVYTIPEATGYFQVGRSVDVKEGDQIQFIGKFLNTDLDLTKRTLSVIKVEDAWLFNRVEYKWVAVK